MKERKLKGKGTVTPLASVFPPEEAQKAANRIHDAIGEKKTELNSLLGFVNDNDNLVNLVQKLPEKLSHDIMVPFGKAAFFPGRLIHTNEFLVLLGEGYYADRTSKQTVEILQRRGKALDSQADSLQANIKDLEAEALFFSATASEVAEGLVEIREEEEDSDEGESKSGPLKQDAPNLGYSTTDDEEYARMMAIMDELEKEELAAESANQGDLNVKTTPNLGYATTDDVEYARMMSSMDELEKEELAAESANQSDLNVETTSGFDNILYQRPMNNNLQSSEDIHQGVQLDQTNNKVIAAEFPKKHNHQKDIADQLNFASLTVQSKGREGKFFAQNVESSDPNEELPIIPKEKIAQAATASKMEVQNQTSQPSFDSSKAFTGSIVEHAENLRTSSKEKNPTSSQISGSQPSKPVSRFKMQRK
ncbi:uncharacterized protein LOC130746886 [Lotus japonicus]|uniref:uncharacterized protein LOC130746886 n=1 Tax=Lotus japonicus TaxID=34305 RepID=UPI00258690B8|nr:uncharacterized protein LOC130746886 [Lotus japonicus]